MKRFALALVAGVMIALPALADGRSQLISSVKHELPRYVSGVDVNTLSTSKLSRLHLAIYGGGSDSDKQRKIRSILGGKYSLFGTLRIGIRN